jgi:hypothetical protein
MGDVLIIKRRNRLLAFCMIYAAHRLRGWPHRISWLMARIVFNG